MSRSSDRASTTTQVRRWKLLPIDPFSRWLPRLQWLPRRRRGWILAAIVAVSILLTAPAQGQSPTPTPSPSPSATPTVPVLPNFNSLFTNRSNSTSRGIVRLDGRPLFTIAAPAAQPATPTSGQRPQQSSSDPIDLRIEVIQDRLQRIAESDFDPDSLRVTNEVDSESSLPVISVR
ncbi:MAG: hypothetical protein F6K28_59795, partial [Microcoleus sp. SIO2G3]|nr:hypothetical protein [Microcoleus sp. SIO2G3]